MSARGVVKGLAGAVALLLVYPLAAYADNVHPDGDISVEGTDIKLDACVLPSVEVAGKVGIKRTGNENFVPGERLSVRYETPSQIRVTGPDMVTVPLDYEDKGNGNESTFFFDIKTQVLAGAAEGRNQKVSISVVGDKYTAKNPGSYEVSWNCVGGFKDTTPPTLTLPADITVEATSSAGANVSFEVKATDGEGDATVSVPVTCSTPEGPATSGDVFPLGTTTVTCSATDAAGNTATGSFTVTVEDTTAPEIGVLPDITTQATSAAGAQVEFGPFTAHDVVDGEVAVTCGPTSGSVFPLGETTVECTATDAAGNSSTADFMVKVVVGWGGFLQPLNPGGPATFKLNSTIPVKFQLAGASAGITDLDARLYVQPVGGGDEWFDAISTSKATTGNAFRWDADGGFYIFNLNTKEIGKAGKYVLRVDLGDGVPHTIQVEIRK